MKAFTTHFRSRTPIVGNGLFATSESPLLSFTKLSTPFLSNFWHCSKIPVGFPVSANRDSAFSTTLQQSIDSFTEM
jgi:hypothetical protein